ncbi:hypothetical protein ABES02_14900 [Neobacillus pocheonensis]|uniref:hypothetical protein n=1 Tax=Neobacillus pocheonensis TaxID=363869 RepID=UPI003D2C4699
MKQGENLYRLAAANGEMTHDEEKKQYYTLKLKQYGEFADDSFSLLFYDVFTIMSLISEQQAYEEALSIIDQYFSNPKLADVFEVLFLLEKEKPIMVLNALRKPFFSSKK